MKAVIKLVETKLIKVIGDSGNAFEEEQVFGEEPETKEEDCREDATDVGEEIIRLSGELAGRNSKAKELAIAMNNDFYIKQVISDVKP